MFFSLKALEQNQYCSPVNHADVSGCRGFEKQLCHKPQITI